MKQEQDLIFSLQKPFYSIYEAAEILGVHERTVRNYIKTGEIKAGKVGRQWRIAKEDLLRYVQPQN